ncbi:hypothetical protein HFN98_05750 [Rhizobium laguerreae]|uniref:hypothetical protein n=1 Tax=Rhizobium laguerreae TaxID=1076926 RepID=UPI001C907134|nr:hypothetical protein [Rhizobium laguerreae]MBY3330151.1 hypothetical protein [Rhizobium laguerreae]
MLLASPAAAKSTWVCREVERWGQNRPQDRLFIAVTDGNLAWDENAGDFDWAATDCLPSVLKARFAGEPLWIDLRNTKRQHELSLRYSAFRLAVLDLASPQHGRPKDELDGEDVRQHRRARVTAWSAGIILAILAIVSTPTAVAAWEQSQIGRSRELAAVSVAQLQSDPDVASILALESVNLRPKPQAESALRSAVGSHDLRFTLEGHSTIASPLAFQPGRKVAGQRRPNRGGLPLRFIDRKRCAPLVRGGREFSCIHQ